MYLMVKVSETRFLIWKFTIWKHVNLFFRKIKSVCSLFTKMYILNDNVVNFQKYNFLTLNFQNSDGKYFKNI